MKELASSKDKVDDFKEAVNRTIRNAMSAVRKGTQLAIVASEAIFGSLSAVTRYAIEGVVQTAELLTTVLTATSLTNPLLIFRAGVQLASIVAIYVQVNKMIQGHAEQAQQAGRTAIFFRTLSTSF